MEQEQIVNYINIYIYIYISFYLHTFYTNIHKHLT